MEETQNEFQYLDQTIELSFESVDKSDLPIQEKRSLLFSLYSFRCLFNNTFLHSDNKILRKYGCSFIGQQEGEGSIKLTHNGRTFYKYDAGSPMWIKAVKSGEITGDSAIYPEKLSLYEMVLSTITLSSATNELKGLWYIHFPYIIYIDAPHEQDLYSEIKKILFTDDVFNKVLQSRASDNIYILPQDLLGQPPLIVDWYTPFVEWKNVKNDKGVSRELAKYQKALANGDSNYALKGTEQLLDAFPDDEEIALLNIASRCELCAKVDENTRLKLLNDNLILIEEYIKDSPKNHVYFLYYRGLTKLALGDADKAVFDFKECLDIDPNFKLAKLMLKGMQYTAHRDNKMNNQ